MKSLSNILAILRHEFALLLGNRLDGMYLYGSQARGDAHTTSDIDILAVINGKFDYSDLLQRTSTIVASLSLDNEVVISRAFVSQEQYDQEQSPFLINVRREGVAI